MPVAVEEAPKKEYRPFDLSVIRTGGASEFDDYVKYPSEEAIKAHITELKIGSKVNSKSDEEEDRLYIYAMTDEDSAEGGGKGQVYRGDVAPVISNGSKKSNLSLFLEKVYGEPRDGVEVDGSGQPEMIGRPIRIELSEPWGERGLQFIKAFKKPMTTQKRAEVKKDVTPANLISEAEMAAAFDAAGDVSE